MDAYFASYAPVRPKPDSLGRVEFLTSMVNKEVLALTALSVNRPFGFEDRATMREHTERVLSNALYQRFVLDSVVVTDDEVRRSTRSMAASSAFAASASMIPRPRQRFAPADLQVPQLGPGCPSRLRFSPPTPAGWRAPRWTRSPPSWSRICSRERSPTWWPRRTASISAKSSRAVKVDPPAFEPLRPMLAGDFVICGRPSGRGCCRSEVGAPDRDGPRHHQHPLGGAPGSTACRR